MNLEQHREIAERHWHFISGLLKSGSITDDRTLEVCHYLYVEAWIHGVKHELDITCSRKRV